MAAAGVGDDGSVIGDPTEAAFVVLAAKMGVSAEETRAQLPRRAEVLALFDQLPPATVVSHREMLQFVDRHRLMGQGLGWIDLHLLASALVSHATLATRDGRLAQAARGLGVAA